MPDSSASSFIPEHALEVAAGLVFRDGRLLITQRHADTHLGGLWEFPGGKREPRESFEACLVRELQEELGIEVAVHELIESVTHDYPEKTVHLRFFRCQWLRYEPQIIGCADFRWVRKEELKSYAFPAADAKLIEKLAGNSEYWRRF